MAAKVLCILVDGVEEIELVTPVDILRRAGAEVVMATSGAGREVVGKMGIRIRADAFLSGIDPSAFDALLLPGGPAVAVLRKEEGMVSLVRSFGDAGKVVAGICAAPLLLHDAGLLEGRRHTAHFTTHKELMAAEGEERVIVDGSLVTSRGAGTAVEFGLALAALLEGKEAVKEVAEAIMA